MNPGVRQLLFTNGTRAANGTLFNWFSGGVSGKKVCCWGDSTFAAAAALFTILTLNQRYGDPLQGVTVTNNGENGATLDALNTNAGLTNYIGNIIAAAPNLVVLCAGINDVRSGGCDKETLKTRIRYAVNTIKAALPTCDFVLWTPNSLLTTNVGSLNYVTPNTSAQAYTDIMWRAYNEVRGEWGNAFSLDKQTEIFGRSCPATSPLMTDQLHPSSPLGMTASGAQLLRAIGYQVPFNQALSTAAWLSNPSDPWTVYPYALEDPARMTLAEYGRADTVGSTFIDFGKQSAGDPYVTNWNHQPLIGNINTATDYIQMGRGGPVLKLPGGLSKFQLTADIVRLSGFGAGVVAGITPTPAPGWIYIWRPIP